MKRPIELDELVEHWTLLDDEQGLVAGKRGATRLGFVLLLKFYLRHGRFPRGRSEFGDEVVTFVARQVAVEPGELGFYEWSDRTAATTRRRSAGIWGSTSGQIGRPATTRRRSAGIWGSGSARSTTLRR